MSSGTVGGRLSGIGGEGSPPFGSENTRRSEGIGARWLVGWSLGFSALGTAGYVVTFPPPLSLSLTPPAPFLPYLASESHRIKIQSSALFPLLFSLLFFLVLRGWSREGRWKHHGHPRRANIISTPPRLQIVALEPICPQYTPKDAVLAPSPLHTLVRSRGRPVHGEQSKPSDLG